MIKIYSKQFENRIEWYKEGTSILHREDGPAVEYSDGRKYWYQHGKLHRLDGPAAEYISGIKNYYLNNKLYPNINSDEGWIIFQIIN